MSIQQPLPAEVKKIIVRHKEIVGIYRFGTRRTVKIESPLTDIDLAVVLWPYDRYAAADIALAFPAQFDVTILNEAPAFIVAEVVQKAHVLYVRDEKKLARAMMRITAEIRRHRSFLERMAVLP